ncbi:hypothetical protein [Thioalkalivibrio sp. ALE19]|uniref:hypothetical protein n=1 Tax=Thioalkalivibrio sp. ALE19 TaxID=1266909 RepID=UPI00048EB541|nr:hypothetical protein [Thioalkalivibrio sp. ALE19]
MSSHHKRYRPYIRRQHPSDRADDFSTAMRLALYLNQGWKGWVLVQHGVRGKVLAIAGTQEELVRSVIGPDERFRDWSRRVQAFGALS